MGELMATKEAKEQSLSMPDLAETFMKVSGDMQALKNHLKGIRVVEWSYLEDLALSMHETSSEYRSLLQTKGKEEIDKRKRFLLNIKGDSALDEENKMQDIE